MSENRGKAKAKPTAKTAGTKKKAVINSGSMYKKGGKVKKSLPKALFGNNPNNPKKKLGFNPASPFNYGKKLAWGINTIKENPQLLAGATGGMGGLAGAAGGAGAASAAGAGAGAALALSRGGATKSKNKKGGSIKSKKK